MTEFIRHAIPEVIEVVPPRYGDNRGYFSEVFKRSTFADEGVEIHWVQENQSLSANVGTVRGLHFQIPPMAQDKLVRVLRGAIYDVALDIRKGSPTYGRHVGVTLSAEKGNQLLVPIGLAHCFMTIEPDTEVLYKVSDHYSPDHEGAIRWNDPALEIDWPAFGGEPTLSAKDLEAPLFAEFNTPFS